MKKLITLSEKVKELSKRLENTKERFGSEWNLANRTKASEVCWLEIEGYSTFLDQPLTKEMFEGDAAIFVGFKREMQNIFYNPINRIRIIFFADGVGFEYRNKKGYEDDTNFESPTLHDLAELTKSNQLELK